MTVVPFQQPGVPEAHGLTRAQCEAAAWATSEAPPRRERGAAAINVAMSVALGSPWPYRIYSLPLIRQAQDLVYAFVARVRNRLPGDRPYCDRFPDRCGLRSGE